ncbi:hypothetical protein VTI74DRAFT_8723 [Chaetomium olivicolor]
MVVRAAARQCCKLSHNLLSRVKFLHPAPPDHVTRRITQIKWPELLTLVLDIDFLALVLPKVIIGPGPSGDLVDSNAESKELLLDHVQVLEVPAPQLYLVPPLVALVIPKVMALNESSAEVADLDAVIREEKDFPAAQVAGQNSALMSIAERSECAVGCTRTVPSPDRGSGRQAVFSEALEDEWITAEVAVDGVLFRQAVLGRLATLGAQLTIAPNLVFIQDRFVVDCRDDGPRAVADDLGRGLHRACGGDGLSMAVPATSRRSWEAILLHKGLTSSTVTSI